MIERQNQPERQALTEMVLKIYVSRYLRPSITAHEMIRVFELVEYNLNGTNRLKSLIKEDYVIDLTKQQTEEAIELLSDYPTITNHQFSKGILTQYLSDFHKEQFGKRYLTERVIKLNEAGFLHPTLTAGAMICVFDLIEQNFDAEKRLQRLIQEECTIELNELQIQRAIEFLNDYPSSSNTIA